MSRSKSGKPKKKAVELPKDETVIEVKEEIQTNVAEIKTEVKFPEQEKLPEPKYEKPEPEPEKKGILHSLFGWFKK